MTRNLALTLGLALSTLSAAAPGSFTQSTFVLDGNRWQPAAVLCDAPDRVITLSNSGAASIAVYRRFFKANPARVTRTMYSVGAPDGAAGSIYRPLYPLQDGVDTNTYTYYIRTSNVQGTASGETMDRVSLNTPLDGRVSCRWASGVVFLGVTGRRTVIVRASNGRVTYTSRDFDGQGGVTVTGGQHTTGGQEEYTWTTPDGYAYRLAVGGVSGGPGATLTVSRNGKTLGQEGFLAYSVSRPARGQP
ncbi:hypothetical protein [Deinococcus apachensis]|uniref:hypothetical protein n=1 Tax=Deinococcus apachensis TaxID=309886 RepID=UPI0012F794EE|nr:hypothetical protein [Deinococcus apachensis]